MARETMRKHRLRKIEPPVSKYGVVFIVIDNVLVIVSSKLHVNEDVSHINEEKAFFFALTCEAAIMKNVDINIGDTNGENT